MEDINIFDASKFLDDFKMFQEQDFLEQNIVKKELEVSSFKIEKWIDKPFARALDFIETKIFIENYTENIFNNLIVQDNLYSGTTLVLDSCYINNKQFSDIHPQLGIKVDKLKAFETIVIRFLVRVNMSRRLANSIEGFATVFFEDGKCVDSNIVKINLEKIEENEKSKIIMKKIYQNLYSYKTDGKTVKIREGKMLSKNPNIEINLLAENSYCEEGDIKCLLKIENKSNFEIFAIRIIDDLIKSKAFVIVGKIKLNGKEITCDNLNQIEINNLEYNKSCYIEFKLKLYKNINYPKISMYCCFEYYDNGKLRRGESNCCSEELTLEKKSFKDCSFNFIYDIPKYLEEPDQIDDIKIESYINKSYPIKTYKASGYNENLTGYGIKFIGEIFVVIEYTSKRGTVHSINFSKQFSSLIIVTEKVYNKACFTIECLVVDSIVDILKNRTINIAVNILFLSDN
ncbi:MAG: hypothetical protein ACRDDL_08085 [Sarcina sp.]